MNLFEISLEQRLMNTNFCFTAAVPESRVRAAEATLEEALRLCAKLEDDLSEFRPGTPVARLNAARAGTTLEMPESVRELWRLAEHLKSVSGGAFDPLCKSSESGTITIDQTGRAHKSRDGVRLTFGAIGKGYALDRVAALLEREGFNDFLLNAGGSSIILCGRDADRLPWSWGWSWEKTADGYAGRKFSHAGPRIALGISGTQEQGAHIIGAPTAGADGEVRSALVAHPSAARADALSTALFVSGWNEFGNAADAPDSEVARALVTTGQEIHWNGGFQNLWGPVC